VSPQRGSRWFVFEAVKQRSRVEESDGRYAQGHSLILEEDADTEIFAGML
jgi:hypothetical protein